MSRREGEREGHLIDDVCDGACYVVRTQARTTHSQVVCGHLPAYIACSGDDINVPVQEELSCVPTSAFDGMPALRILEVPSARLFHAELAPRRVDPAFGVPANDTSLLNVRT